MFSMNKVFLVLSIPHTTKTWNIAYDSRYTNVLFFYANFFLIRLHKKSWRVIKITYSFYCLIVQPHPVYKKPNTEPGYHLSQWLLESIRIKDWSSTGVGMLRKHTWQKIFTRAFQDAQTFPIKGEEGFLRISVLWVIKANKLIQMKKKAWWISVDSFFIYS